MKPGRVIEALAHQDPEKMFVLTQFHPESNVSNISLRLLENLLVKE